MRWAAVILLGTLALLLASQSGRPERSPSAGLVTVSPPSPFQAACNAGQSGTNTRNGPVEPFVAADPRNPGHFVGVWQQDRWSDGGASGLLAGVTFNGGLTWTISSAAFTGCQGGSYARASDPWVTISPDGTVHQIALALADANQTSAIVVSRSADGGLTWSSPITVQRDTLNFNDKESITADPGDSHYVYAIWDRTASISTPAQLARTTDGGLTWETSRAIFDPGRGAGAYSNQITVLPTGVLVDLTILAMNQGSSIAIIRSQDHGQTWSSPIAIATDRAIGTVDAKTQMPVRTAGLDMGVDPGSGAMYVVWEDARFGAGQREGVVMSKSTDGGNSWSAPVQLNQAPQVQAFNPAVAVNAGGAVAVTYYDFRNDTSDPAILITNCWRLVSRDGGNTWTETALAGPFDMLSAPNAGGASFVGDYQGLVPSGLDFLAFFVMANSGNVANPSSVFSRSGPGANAAHGNGHREINLNPRTFWDRLERKPGEPRELPLHQ